MQFSQVQQSSSEFKAIERQVFGFIFSQMSATKGIKKHGEKVEVALFNEAKQLCDLKAFSAFDARGMTETERKEVLASALRAINLIKEK